MKLLVVGNDAVLFVVLVVTVVGDEVFTFVVLPGRTIWVLIIALSGIVIVFSVRGVCS